MRYRELQPWERILLETIQARARHEGDPVRIQLDRINRAYARKMQVNAEEPYNHDKYELWRAMWVRMMEKLFGPLADELCEMQDDNMDGINWNLNYLIKNGHT